MTAELLPYSSALITDPVELGELGSRVISEGKPVGFDIETGYEGETREKAALHPEENFISGISFTSSLDWARYVPLRHDSGTNLDNTAAAYLFWKLLTARDSEGLPLGVAHGAKFERRVMARWFLRHLAGHPELGAEVIAARGYPLLRSCTLLERYAEGESRSLGLKELTLVHYGIKMTELLELFPDLTKKEQKSIRFSVLDQHDPKVVAYACDDAHKALMHHLDLYPRIRNHPIYQLEMAVLREAVCDMEDTGIDYDWIRMRESAAEGKDFAARYLFEIGRDFESWLGHPLPPKFSFGSPQQLGRLLFDEKEDGGLGLPVRHHTPGGKPSTNAKTALKGLSKQHEPVQKLLDWKGLTKLWRDFLEAYEQKYSWSADGRAHASLIQHGTVTGRTSKQDPNDQQSPKKYKYQLEDGTQFSHNFRDNIRAPLPGMRLWWQLLLQEQGLWQPDPGADQLRWYMLGFDWSQIELRAIAGEAGETALLEAFGRGEDVHRLTASLMLGIPWAAVSDEMRQVGKAQPMYEQVLTPQGWRQMGELQVGDQVIGSSGDAVKVEGVYPRGIREVYRVITSDGAAVECCDEHLWTVRNKNTGTWRTYQLKDLVASGLRQKSGKARYAQPKYELPARPVIQYSPGPDLPVDPYVLGLLLGDGGFTQEVQFCSADQELLDAVRAEHVARGGRATELVEQRPGFWHFYLRSGQPFDRSGNIVKAALRQYGLLGLRDHQKFVPQDYLQASPADRLALLQGLLDTDGTVLASGAQFRVVSEQLALGVQELARSLGGWASLRSYQKKRSPFHAKSDPQLTWDVYLRLPVQFCPFRLERKKRKWKPPKYLASQHIVAVEEVMPTEVQCIKVSAEDNLYVTRGHLVTHNTMNFALRPGLRHVRGGPG